MTLRTAHLARRLMLLLALAGMVGSCRELGLEGGTSERARLERQKARWARQALSAYRFTYSVACFCFGGNDAIEIEVRGGLVTRAFQAETDQPVSSEVRNTLPTIDALFRAIDRAIVSKADLLEVEYHPVIGYPTRIAIDYSFNAADDEILHVASGLTRLDPE